ncbi:MAG: sodium/proton antiporter NhaB [Proteobacteria bacterium]|nr:MAG: sodium/proton antiporter NhaB [Pseudomonadota bacterium]
MASTNLTQAFTKNFLGQSPAWYKLTIVGFLILNPILVATTGSFVAGWVLIVEFIFCLAMALKCYPLQPGGLLAIEAVVLGMTSAEAVYAETLTNFPVIMLLMFMVAGIYFLKELLLFTFTKVLLSIRSKVALSVLFCAIAAVLSAFLDALTVIAVVITVIEGFYLVYHKIASGKQYHDEHDHSEDRQLGELARADLVEFRGFLRNLIMHAAVGTALGGVMTLVGEPQNLLIAKIAGWDFVEFFVRTAPVSIPVFFVGLLTCAAVEKTRTFGFGMPLPENVRIILVGYDANQTENRTPQDVAKLVIQGLTIIFLVTALGFHLAEVGVIGLTVIVLATAFNGITEEHRIGHAFKEALPFTSLLVVFFAIVAVIHDQHLFTPIIDMVLQLEGRAQTSAFYLANGVLSMISDNVFVATVYITEIEKALINNVITRDQFNLLAVAINTGTNIPSVATPNGQAAFLFLLTSALAPVIKLSYGRMVWMALPYTVTMTLTGLACVWFLL